MERRVRVGGEVSERESARAFRSRERTHRVLVVLEHWIVSALDCRAVHLCVLGKELRRARDVGVAPEHGVVRLLQRAEVSWEEDICCPGRGA